MWTARGRRVAAVAALAFGLGSAAVATGVGPYLRADQDFDPRPLQLGRLGGGVLGRRTSGGGELPESLRRAGAIAEAGLVALVVVVAALLAAAAVTVLARGLARIRLLTSQRAGAVAVDPRDLGEPVDDEAVRPLRDRLARELAAGEEALDAGPPGDAVVACYLAMLDAVEAAGTPRRPYETPTELMHRALAHGAASADALARLTELYREARYSRHVVDDDMRRAARDALRAIRAGLPGVMAAGRPR